MFLETTQTFSNHCFPWCLKHMLYRAVALSYEPATHRCHSMPFSTCNGRERLFDMSLLFPQHSWLDMHPSYFPLNHLFSRLGNPSHVIYRRWPPTADWLLHPHPTKGAFDTISSLGSSGGTKTMIYQTTSLTRILTVTYSWHAYPLIKSVAMQCCAWFCRSRT